MYIISPSLITSLRSPRATYTSIRKFLQSLWTSQTLFASLTSQVFCPSLLTDPSSLHTCDSHHILRSLTHDYFSSKTTPSFSMSDSEYSNAGNDNIRTEDLDALAELEEEGQGNGLLRVKIAISQF